MTMGTTLNSVPAAQADRNSNAYHQLLQGFDAYRRQLPEPSPLPLQDQFHNWLMDNQFGPNQQTMPQKNFPTQGPMFRTGGAYFT